MKPMRRLLVLATALLALPAIVVATAAAEPRDSVGREFPVYDNGGEPDFTVDPQRFTAQMEIVDRKFDVGSCEIAEGTVGGSGYRRILRFDTVVMNGGQTIVMGNPADPANPFADVFFFAECHQHYHIQGFADYSLRNVDGTTVAAQGHKQAFCFISSFKYSNLLNGQDKPAFTCSDQGIASGYGDWYYKQLSGQWIDITGVPEGDYIVRVEVNAAGFFDEGQNRYPNVITTRVHVPDPRNKVAIVP
jgi:hypothetical protein